MNIHEETMLTALGEIETPGERAERKRRAEREALEAEINALRAQIEEIADDALRALSESAER